MTPLPTKPLQPIMPIHRQAILVSRGFSWLFTGPPGQHRSIHDLIFALPVERAILKHGDLLAPVDTVVGNQFLWLASRHWQGSLQDVNTHYWWLTLAQFPKFWQSYIANNVALFLNQAQYHVQSRQGKALVMKTTDKVPPDIMARLEAALGSLEASLLAKDPMMPQHLRASHSLLISYPETVHLLDDKEVAMLIDGAEIHTKTEIVKAAATGKGGSKKKVDVGDL